MPCSGRFVVRALTALAATAVLATARPAAAQTSPTAAAPTVRVAGLAFAQYEIWASDTAAHTNQFDVTRAYLSAIGTFDHGISARITGDVYRNAEKSLGYRLKFAYFTWQPGGKAPVDFRFGMTQTPWIDWQESLYGFRMQGPIPLDRYGYITASDIGAAMDFTTADKGVSGVVAVMNGEGFANPSGGQYKDVIGRGTVRLLKSDDAGAAGGLRLSGYAQVGRFDPSGDARRRFIGELSWKSKALSLGGEYGIAVNGSGHAHVLSGFGVVNFDGSPWQLLTRIDRFDPNGDLGGDAFTRYIAGMAYRLSPNVRVLGDIDAAAYQAAVIAPAAQAQKTRLLFQTELVF